MVMLIPMATTMTTAPGITDLAIVQIKTTNMSTLKVISYTSVNKGAITQ